MKKRRKEKKKGGDFVHQRTYCCRTFGLLSGLCMAGGNGYSRILRHQRPKHVEGEVLMAHCKTKLHCSRCQTTHSQCVESFRIWSGWECPWRCTWCGPAADIHPRRSRRSETRFHTGCCWTVYAGGAPSAAVSCSIPLETWRGRVRTCRRRRDWCRRGPASGERNAWLLYTARPWPWPR